MACGSVCQGRRARLSAALRKPDSAGASGRRFEGRRKIVYELAGVLGRIGERADVADLRDVDSAVAFNAVAEGEVVPERSKAERIAAQVYV